MSSKQKFTDQWLNALKAHPQSEQHFGDMACKGLSLKITKMGVKSFSYTFRLGSRTGRVTLGQYPDIGLADARAKVELLRKHVAEGTDPRQVKIEEKSHRERTVSKMVSKFIDEYAKPNNKSWRQAESNLRLHLVSALGSKPVSAVKRGDIRAILVQLINEGKGPSANRAFAHMRKFFSWLVEGDYLKNSPADHITKPYKERKRERVLSDQEIKAIWDASKVLSRPYRAWLQLSLLCGQREMETACIKRSKIEEGLWFLTSNETKNRRENVLPLSRQAILIIEELMAGEGEHLLSSGRIGDAPLNGFSKAKVQLDKHSGVGDWRLHDLRRSVATNLSKLGYDRFKIKLVLNHKDTGVTEVYDRYTYLEEKREALQKWADRLDEIVS